MHGADLLREREDHTVKTSPEPFSTFGVGGIRIVADRLGDPLAPAVVFLHGGGQTRRSWARAAAAVADEVLVISPTIAEATALAQALAPQGYRVLRRQNEAQQVREILYREKYDARMEAWIKEIKQRAIIEVRM